MQLRPLDVVLQDALGRVAKPGVTFAPLKRNVIHVIVNRLVAVAENRPVGSNFIKARPEGSAARRRHQFSAFTAGVFEFLTFDFSFFKPEVFSGYDTSESSFKKFDAGG